MRAYDPWTQARHAVELCRDQYAGLLDMTGDGDFMVSRRRIGTTVYVVFRGSVDLSDWLRNLCREQMNHPWGRVHKGTYTSLLNNEAVFVDFVRPSYYTHHVFCGHSAGGAYAQLAASLMLMAGMISPAEIDVVTFGSQRVGNDSFAGVLDKRVNAHTAFVYESDPVPGLPKLSSWRSYLNPRQLINDFAEGYVRSGKLQWFNGRTWLSKRTTWGSLKTYVFERTGWLVGDFLQDHKHENYVRSVLKGM